MGWTFLLSRRRWAPVGPGKEQPIARGRLAQPKDRRGGGACVRSLSLFLTCTYRLAFMRQLLSGACSIGRGSPTALLRPCSEKSLDMVQYALVIIRSLQRRPNLTQLSRIADHALWRPREQ